MKVKPYIILNTSRKHVNYEEDKNKVPMNKPYNIQYTNICNGIFHISFFKALLINECETIRGEREKGKKRLTGRTGKGEKRLTGRTGKGETRLTGRTGKGEKRLTGRTGKGEKRLTGRNDPDSGGADANCLQACVVGR
jgi:hypothetical protein